MGRLYSASTSRRPTNVTLPAQLLEEAKSLGLNISQACEQGLVSAITAIRAQQWLRENQAALEASRDYVEKNGLPLADYRTF